MRIVVTILLAVVVGAAGTALPLRAPAPEVQALALRTEGLPRPQRNMAVQRRDLRLIAAPVPRMAGKRVQVRIEGDRRRITASNAPMHNAGFVPNRRNPHGNGSQPLDISLPAAPALAAEPTQLGLGVFGVALNGMLFRPHAAEWYLGQHGSDWQYEPLGRAVALGLATRFADIQFGDVRFGDARPPGTSRADGMPDGLMRQLGVREGRPSPIIGWAYDGFPIYARFAEMDGQVREFRSGYVVRSGQRPGGEAKPGGTYDGTFTEDHEWIGAGDLDECNGAFVRTSDFPDGTYAYFLTRGFPVIPRCFAGTPVSAYHPRSTPG